MGKRAGSNTLICLLFVLMAIIVMGKASAQTTGGGSSGGGELGAICCLMYFFIPLISVVAWGAVALWIKNDAESRGIEEPWLWFFVTFFGGVIGLVIYLAVIRPKGSEPSTTERPSSTFTPGTCPHCGYNAGTVAGRCPRCGGNLSG